MLTKELFELVFDKPDTFIWTEELGCYYQHKDSIFDHKGCAIQDFNNKWYGWLAAMQSNNQKEN